MRRWGSGEEEGRGEEGKEGRIHMRHKRWLVHLRTASAGMYCATLHLLIKYPINHQPLQKRKEEKAEEKEKEKEKEKEE